MTHITLFPEQASTLAPQTDLILAALLALSGAIIVAVLGLVVVFALRYRRGSGAKRDILPEWMTRDFEIGWVSATFFLFLFLSWWTGATAVSALIPPKNAMEVHVVAKQWMWKTQHPDGAREINSLHVPIGAPVRLVMTSEDVIHSFFVPAFRMKQDVLPGRYTTTWFNATKTGVFRLFCAQYCGTQHSRMQGEVVVMTSADYAKWLAAQPHQTDIAREGEALFASLGCSGCHAENSKVGAPKLAGLYGRTIELADGGSAVLDDSFIRDMVLHPKDHAIKNYPAIMPAYAGLLGDDELLRLAAYIRSLSKGSP